MSTEAELEKSVLKSFINMCICYGQFNNTYCPETLETLEQASHTLTQFARALRLKLNEKMDAADGELES